MSYERNQIISLLYRIFQAEGYHWYDNRFSLNLPKSAITALKEKSFKIPTYEEIKDVLSGLEYDAEKCKDRAETGRLMVAYDKEGQCFDYYLNLGSL